MRVVAHMVTRNEAGRYLKLVLDQLRLFGFDMVTVYDDRSTDKTLEVALSAGAMVQVRSAGVPPFADDESAFRQAAWSWMMRFAQPDVVLSIDADELLMAKTTDLRACLRAAATEAQAKPWRLDKAELWSIGDDWVPRQRVDGLWKGISDVRLVPGGDTPFQVKRLAGGTVPDRWFDDGCPRTCGLLSIAHLGYLSGVDREEKYARYRGRMGHNPRHVASILTTPTLEPRPDLQPWPRKLR